MTSTNQPARMEDFSFSAAIWPISGAFWTVKCLDLSKRCFYSKWLSAIDVFLPLSSFATDNKQKEKKNIWLNELLVPAAIISRREKVSEMCFFFVFGATAQIAAMNGNYSCTDWLVNDCYYVQIWQTDEESCMQIRPDRLPTATRKHLLWLGKLSGSSSTCLKAEHAEDSLSLDILASLWFVDLVLRIICDL